MYRSNVLKRNTVFLIPPPVRHVKHTYRTLSRKEPDTSTIPMLLLLASTVHTLSVESSCSLITLLDEFTLGEIYVSPCSLSSALMLWSSSFCKSRLTPVKCLVLTIQETQEQEVKDRIEVKFFSIRIHYRHANRSIPSHCCHCFSFHMQTFLESVHFTCFAPRQTLNTL